MNFFCCLLIMALVTSKVLRSFLLGHFYNSGEKKPNQNVILFSLLRQKRRYSLFPTKIMTRIWMFLNAL